PALFYYGRALFFSPATATPATYPLSLHDALPILRARTSRVGDRDLPSRARDHSGGDHRRGGRRRTPPCPEHRGCGVRHPGGLRRSEEHTSELQSRENLVCRLLLEKKNNNKATNKM